MVKQYYINTKLIKQVMNERDMDVKRLSEETGVSVHRLSSFIQGTVPRRGSLEIAFQLRLKLGIILEDMYTNKPPEKE